jgi:GH24 family phage-related lysozyme (muramidase)
MPRRINAAGLELIKSFEGFRATTYTCPGGKPTIGWGHVIQPGESFVEPISPAQGLSILARDLAQAEAAVERLVTAPLTDNQFAALVSFTFNLGQGNLQKSTLLKKLNAGDYAGAANELPKWRMAGGQVLEGLVRRRAAERALFLTPDQPAAAETLEGSCAPFAANPKEVSTMNWLLTGPILSLAIKAGKAMLPMLLNKFFPGLSDLIRSEVSPGMKELIGKGLAVAQEFVESTDTNLDNYIVEAAAELADSLGLLPDGPSEPATLAEAA